MTNTQAWDAYIHVVRKVEDEDQAAAVLPQRLTDEVPERVTTVINQWIGSVVNQINLTEDPAPHSLKVSAVVLEFGIDIEAETGIPIITPLTGTRAKAGATFKISVSLNR